MITHLWWDHLRSWGLIIWILIHIMGIYRDYTEVMECLLDVIVRCLTAKLSTILAVGRMWSVPRRWATFWLYILNSLKDNIMSEVGFVHIIHSVYIYIYIYIVRFNVVMATLFSGKFTINRFWNCNTNLLLRDPRKTAAILEGNVFFFLAFWSITLINQNIWCVVELPWMVSFLLSKC